MICEVGDCHDIVLHDLAVNVRLVANLANGELRTLAYLAASLQQRRRMKRG